MLPLIKVCGITRPQDAQLALDLGADFVGIIFYGKSPRCVSDDQLPALLDVIPKEKRVMVDVAPSPEVLQDRVAMEFAAYQIHFDLDTPMGLVASWSQLFGDSAFWAAPRIPPEEEMFPQVLMQFCDTFVVDAYAKDKYGGTGHSRSNWQRYLDWTHLYQHKRWVLAGGLAPENVREALLCTGAEMIDVNSGVESAPGIKDAARLGQFFREVRAYSEQGS